tara:strand:- start:35505 stop:35615 length:111 start_codon:yes stop_codon:yes gene_type:complete
LAQIPRNHQPAERGANGHAFKLLVQQINLRVRLFDL